MKQNSLATKVDSFRVEAVTVESHKIINPKISLIS